MRFAQWSDRREIARPDPGSERVDPRSERVDPGPEWFDHESEVLDPEPEGDHRLRCAGVRGVDIRGSGT